MLSAPEPPDSEPAEPGGSAGDVRNVLPSVAAVLPSSSELNRAIRGKSSNINIIIMQDGYKPF